MKGKCESCGLTDVEVTEVTKDGRTKVLCNQCRPADGAYAY